MLTDLELQEWQAYVDTLKPILRLSDWRISMSKEPPDGDAHAATWLSRDYKESVLYLSEKWRTYNADKLRALIAHELIHAHAKELNNFSKDVIAQLGGQAKGLAEDAMHHFLEKMVEEIAWAIAPFLPYPPESKESSDEEQS